MMAAGWKLKSRILYITSYSLWYSFSGVQNKLFHLDLKLIVRNIIV
jgi:hypothetical protein